MRVVLRNVCKDIKGARVLDNVNLELESGMVYGFKGKNGSGKTMLMRAISGLIMLMCHKVTHKNLIDSSPLFRYYLTHTPCNFFVKPIDSDTSEEI